jgi:predicted type IV restriction endonuclease
MGEDFFEIALRNLKILQKSETSEQDVKRLVVEPIMKWAGIDIYDPNTLREEYKIPQVNHTTYADYAIFGDGIVKMAVEAKNISENLTYNLKQLIDYCNYGNIRFGIITNGAEWWFIDETWREAKERVFLKIRFESEYIELLKLMNPFFLDILEEFAHDYERIQSIDFINKSDVESSVCKGTLKKIRKRVEHKDSENFSLKETTEDFVTIAEFLDFSRKSRKNRIISGLKCPGRVFIGNKKVDVKYWNDIFVNFMSSSYKKIDIPFKVSESSARYIINTQSIHSDGKNMIHPHKIMDKNKVLFLETNFSLINILNIIERVKKAANLPDDYIKFPAEWFEYAKSYIREKEKNG